MADIIKNLIPKIKTDRKCECHNALEYAIITSSELIKKNGNPKVNQILLKKYLK